jgi:hypothetical protein
VTRRPCSSAGPQGEDWWLSTAAGDRVVLGFSDGRITVGWLEPTHTIVDDDARIATHYGLAGERTTIVLDERLRVLAALDDPTRLPEVVNTPQDDIPAPPRRAPLGGAIVFSCSLLREVTPVTQGRRYCTVPFLCDEAGEEHRRRSRQYVSPVD